MEDKLKKAIEKLDRIQMLVPTTEEEKVRISKLVDSQTNVINGLRKAILDLNL